MSLAATATVATAQWAYVQIDTTSLRTFVDQLAPSLAKCSQADYLSGYGHRYRGGHDLLVDVFSTYKAEGARASMHQAGHILLTDFPTKAGIPIPGLSASGLGSFLQEVGINSGWLQLNICDAGVGILAIAEGSSDLLHALDGTLDMSLATFFDTYVEGGIMLALSAGVQNPLLLTGGIENILAGVFSTAKTIVESMSVYIDPIDFFGAGVTSAICGCVLTLLFGQRDSETIFWNTLRAGFTGCCFVINPAFGFGVICGYIAFGLGKKLSGYSSRESDTQSTVELEELLDGFIVSVQPLDEIENLNEVEELDRLEGLAKVDELEHVEELTQVQGLCRTDDLIPHEPLQDIEGLPKLEGLGFDIS